MKTTTDKLNLIAAFLICAPITVALMGPLPVLGLLSVLLGPWPWWGGALYASAMSLMAVAGFLLFLSWATLPVPEQTMDGRWIPALYSIPLWFFSPAALSYSEYLFLTGLL